MYKNHKKYALTNCTLLDGTADMQPLKGVTLHINGDIIEEIAESGAVKDGYEAIDMGGRYVMPGLINLHVHLPATGKPRKKPSDPKKLVKLITSNGFMRKIGVKMCESYAKTELLSGVTTLRTVGGVADFDTIIRNMANDCQILAPRIVASNMAVSVLGGHMAG